jgi:ribosomal protein S27AE
MSREERRAFVLRRDPEKVRAADCARYQRDKEKRHRLAAEYRRKNPEKIKARSTLYSALRTGRIERQPCERCGAEKVQAHHDDYSRPLDVRWLCRDCHWDVHHPNHPWRSP